MSTQKNCANCGQTFPIFDEDISFYKKIDVPSPSHCSDCRRQRRFTFRNERCLYKRTCDMCKKPIISVYDEKSDYTVYCYECWWGDTWDPFDYGRDFDFTKSFFWQFHDLEKKIPHFALFQDETSENCEYVNYGMNNKSCYLCLVAYCEDVYYSHSLLQCKSCMDCQKCIKCELCYDCIDVTGSYQLFFSQDCFNCSESYFLKDCVSSKNCFCSVSLKNKKFVFLNEQLSEETYKKRMESITFTASSIKLWEEKREELSKKIPKKYIHGVNNNNVTGNNIYNSSNLHECYDAVNMENSRYFDTGGMQSREINDCSYGGAASENCFEVDGFSAFYNSKFISYGRAMQNSEYCQYCFSSEHLFGCMGLRHKKYCILNKQYTEEEYKNLVPKIIEYMRKTKEYGEFFPIKDSPFAYNETLAHEYYPLKKNEVIRKGWKWRDVSVETQNPASLQKLNIPDNIQKVPDTITDEILSCEQCGKNYKIMSKEFAFYKRMGIPIPLKCHDCRHKIRFSKRNPKKLWDRKCQKCGKEIKTTYAPERPEIVYCSSCWIKEIY